ncbi:MAG TPA: FliH/SctL family protein [Gemmatimonadaceae bacterium]|nr:FliH/SctL family protein [Gemmatimonadaceae bacterium]
MISLPESSRGVRARPDGIASWIPGDLPAVGMHNEDLGSPPEPDPVEAAYQRGITEGRRLGALEAEERLRPAVDAMEAAAEALAEVREKLAANFADHLHLLAVAVARQLIQREIAADAEIVVGLVERALTLVPPDQRVRVHVNPEDLATVRKRIEGRIGDRQIEWVADPAIERGSCVADSPSRVVDGRLDRALLAVLEKLRNG